MLEPKVNSVVSSMLTMSWLEYQIWYTWSKVLYTKGVGGIRALEVGNWVTSCLLFLVSQCNSLQVNQSPWLYEPCCKVTGNLLPWCLSLCHFGSSLVWIEYMSRKYSSTTPNNGKHFKGSCRNVSQSYELLTLVHLTSGRRYQDDKHPFKYFSQWFHHITLIYTKSY